MGLRSILKAGQLFRKLQKIWKTWTHGARSSSIADTRKRKSREYQADLEPPRQFPISKNTQPAVVDPDTSSLRHSKEFPFNPSGAEPINDDSDLYSSNPFSPIVTDESSRLLPAAAASSPALVTAGGSSTDDSSPPPQFNKPLPTLPREEEQPQPPISVTPFADDDVFFDAKSPAPDAPLSWPLPADPATPFNQAARPIIIPVHPRRKREGETDESYEAAMAEVRATMPIETLIEMRYIAYAIAHPPDTAFLSCKLVHTQPARSFLRQMFPAHFRDDKIIIKVSSPVNAMGRERLNVSEEMWASMTSADIATRPAMPLEIAHRQAIRCDESHSLKDHAPPGTLTICIKQFYISVVVEGLRRHTLCLTGPSG
ncbi:hypothetical protein SLS54_003111 [Diplodia seriata]